MSCDIWYESQVGHGVLASIMSRMSEDAGLSRSYTNTSVRVTAAEVLEKNGLFVDDVMGINPKNKTAKSVQQAMSRIHTTDELLHTQEHTNVHGVLFCSYSTLPVSVFIMVLYLNFLKPPCLIHNNL
jgi:hypothetical protein